MAEMTLVSWQALTLSVNHTWDGAVSGSGGDSEILAVWFGESVALLVSCCGTIGRATAMMG